MEKKDNLYKCSVLYLAMGKRGISHTEVILSFIIFAAAVGFALWFFNPSDPTRRIDSSLEYGFREIIKNTSVQMDRFSVKINNNTLRNAGFSGAIAVNVSGVAANKNVFAWSINGLPLKSKRNAATNLVEINSSAGWQNVDFISLEFSEEFQDGSFLGGIFNESYYEISSHESKEVISEKRFLELRKNYFDDYSALRDDFNIHVNFGFVLDFSNSSIVAERQVPEGLEVFSDKRRVEVLRNESGRIEFGDLIVKVW
jgi:hypothetical protein